MTPATPEAVFAALGRVEAVVDPAQWRINGVDMWPAVRTYFVMAHYQRISGTPQGWSHSARLVRKVRAAALSGRTLLRDGWRASPRVSEGERPEVVLLTDAMNRRHRIEGRWYDTLLGPVEQWYRSHGTAVSVLESNQNFLDRTPAYSARQPLLGLMLRGYVAAGRSVGGEAPPALAAAHVALGHEMRAASDVDALVPLEVLRREAAFVGLLSRRFGTLLRGWRPQVVIMAPYSGFSGRAMCHAARGLGIQAVDLQHGVQGAFHPTYSKFQRVPPGGFNTMPTTFLSWTDEDARQIRSWAAESGAARAEVVGNLYYDAFEDTGALPGLCDAELRRVFPSNDRRRLVLVTDGGWSAVPQAIAAVMERARDEMRFLVRLHPNHHGHRRALVRDLQRFGEAVEWRAASSLPLPALLTRVAAHLTVGSSVVLEAAEYGVGSVIVGTIGQGYYASVIARGLATPAAEPEAILAALRACVASPARAARRRSQPAVLGGLLNVQ